MNSENKQNNIEEDIKENVLQKIECGEVSMRPKSFFIFKAILLISVALLTILISSVLISYILFSLKAGGKFFLLGFGFRGFYTFLFLFPWILISIDVVLLLFLDWLLKNFKFGYNRPILYLFLATLVIISFLGLLINITPFHGSMMNRAEHKNLPYASSFYDGLRKSQKTQGMFRGKVVSIEGNLFNMEQNDYDSDSSTGVLKVIMPPGFKISDILKIGDLVFVAGDLSNDQITAYGIRRLTSNE